MLKLTKLRIFLLNPSTDNRILSEQVLLQKQVSVIVVFTRDSARRSLMKYALFVFKIAVTIFNSNCAAVVNCCIVARRLAISTIFKAGFH